MGIEALNWSFPDNESLNCEAYEGDLHNAYTMLQLG